MATHSSIHVQEIPWTEELGGAAVHRITRIGHDLATKPPPQNNFYFYIISHDLDFFFNLYYLFTVWLRQILVAAYQAFIVASRYLSACHRLERVQAEAQYKHGLRRVQAQQLWCAGPVACEILVPTGIEPCPLHWRVYS